jgi:alpha-1,4-digalacturonate transport system substrate-binding protein
MVRPRHVRQGLLAAVAGGALITGLVGAGAAGATTEPPGTEPAGTEAAGTDLTQFEGQSMTYVYFSDGEADLAATEAAVAAFEEASGADVEIQVVAFPDLETTLQAALSGGDVPHVARVSNWRPYEGDVVDMNEAVGADYSSQFLAGQVATAVNADGQFLAVPSDITMNGPIINVDAFNEAGVEIPTEWTWEEMIAAATEVQEAVGMEFAMAIDRSGHRVSTVLSQFGTVLFNADGVALDPAKAEAAITTLTDLMAEETMDPDFWIEGGTRYADARELFLAGGVPVWISGNWQVAGLATEASFEWAAVPNPCAERCGGFPGGKYMVAFSGSDNPELGAAFVEFMNSTEIQQGLCEGASWLPTRNDLIESGIEYPDRNDDMNVFLADVAATPEDTYLSLASPAFSAGATAVVDEIALVVAGEQDVATAVENIIAASEQGVEDAS